jgi:hypothetical protein
MARIISFFLLLLAVAAAAHAQPIAMQDCAQPAAVCEQDQNGGAKLIDAGIPAPVIADGTLDPGVIDAVEGLRGDLGQVAGKPSSAAPARVSIIVGTFGHSPVIDRLVREKRLNPVGVSGQWEAYLQQVVDNPAPGISRALIIAGADKRGTIFGIYDLSRRIGVSPWNWWADVPAKHHADLWITAGRRVEKPTVKYRGIFINDEDPALGGWAKATFGGTNHQFYDKVAHLILRSSGNYLWPAMWGRSYYEDDPQTAALFNKLGVVVGTSHHEPLMRAHVDWERHGDKTPWDYTKNAERLHNFWREGMERTQGQEKLVTIGMRGDGDEPMTQGTAIDLLERIVADQRKIIADVTGKPASETPQVWALYKEVQDYYDKGMRVPDDVTLLFSDDNWGDIRRLPDPGAKRAGGYGIYYHFDYVGGPRNYKWINTNQIERTWEQMHLARAYGADRLWIVNVGDIKPMEYPISFFLDYAWDPDGCALDCLANYPRKWAAEQFGDAHAAEIGELLTRYTQYNARRKPELIDADTFSLDNFGEADRVVRDWSALAAKAEAVGKQLPADTQDAYFELVLYPILASANLNDLYVTVARNRQLAAEGDVRANSLAERAKALFARHAELRHNYESRAGGKWTDMMSQTVFGYTSWQQPDRDIMPEVRTMNAPTSRADVLAVDDYPIGPFEVPIGTHGFIEDNGIVAIEAPHYSNAVSANGIDWKTIPNLGRTLGAVTAFPVTAPAQLAGKGPHLDYDVYLRADGAPTLQVVTAPTLDIRGRGQLRYAVSIDGQAPQIVNLATDSEAEWSKAVAQNAWIKEVPVHVDGAGQHVIHLWQVDPGVDFERLVLFRAVLPKSYLGPPESERR